MEALFNLGKKIQPQVECQICALGYLDKTGDLRYNEIKEKTAIKQQKYR